MTLLSRNPDLYPRLRKEKLQKFLTEPGHAIANAYGSNRYTTFLVLLQLLFAREPVRGLEWRTEPGEEIARPVLVDPNTWFLVG